MLSKIRATLKGQILSAFMSRVMNLKFTAQKGQDFNHTFMAAIFLDTTATRYSHGTCLPSRKLLIDNVPK